MERKSRVRKRPPCNLRSERNRTMDQPSVDLPHSMTCSRLSSSRKRKRCGSPRRSPSLQSRADMFMMILDSCYACCLESLRSGGCDVNLRDENGRTPLMIVVEMGQMDLVQLFLSQTPNAVLRNRWGETALYLAVAQYGPNAAAVVRQVLAYDRSAVNIPTASGCVPLFRAVARCQESHAETSSTVAIVQDLIHANAGLDIPGSNPDVLNGQPMTAFQLAATVGNFGLCQLLFDAGCDVSVALDWIRNNRFPKTLLRNGSWKERIIFWAKEPKNLQSSCRIAICAAIRNNGRDVRSCAAHLGLPMTLSLYLLNEE